MIVTALNIYIMVDTIMTAVLSMLYLSIQCHAHIATVGPSDNYAIYLIAM